MIVGFTRYSRDRSFAVLGQNRRFVLVMAAGSVVGSFIGGQLLGLVPTSVLLPLLAAILVPRFQRLRYGGADIPETPYLGRSQGVVFDFQKSSGLETATTPQSLKQVRTASDQR